MVGKEGLRGKTKKETESEKIESIKMKRRDATKVNRTKRSPGVIVGGRCHGSLSVNQCKHGSRPD